MVPVYPDLQTIENKFKKKALEIIKNPLYLGFNVTLFTQVWGNTGTGFCKPGYFYGQAMTTEYTTVISMTWTERTNEYPGAVMPEDSLYGVFFGEKLAYIIRRPNKKFFNDIHKFNMLGIMDCETYKNKNSELYIMD